MNPLTTNPNELPLGLKVDDIAEILGISRGSAYELARRTDFPKIKIGRRIVIPRDAFLKWMEEASFRKVGELA